MLLSRYITRHLFFNSLFLVFSITGIVLLIRAFRFIHFIQEGFSPLVYIYYNLVTFPQLVEICLPIGLFIASATTYQKLHASGELNVIRGLGRSPLRVLLPAVFVAVGAGGVQLFLNWFGTPWAYHERFRIAVHKLQENTFSFLTPKNFLKVQNVTFFVRTVQSPKIADIFILQKRKNSYALTKATKGYFKKSATGAPSIHLEEGHQYIWPTSTKPTSHPSYAQFKSYMFKLERPPPTTFSPDLFHKSYPWELRNISASQELKQRAVLLRFTLPIVTIILGLLGATFYAGYAFPRRGGSPLAVYAVYGIGAGAYIASYLLKAPVAEGSVGIGVLWGMLFFLLLGEGVFLLLARSKKVF